MQTHIAYLSLEQKARPTGVRIVEPPADTRQAVRGSLYAIVELASNQPENAQLVERALSVIQRTYYTVKGTQTFVLTEALREALNLFQEGVSTLPPAEQATRSPKGAEPSANSSLPGILLLSLIDNRMILVGTGPAVALITTGDNVDVYPPYAPRGDREQQSAVVDIHRQELSNGGAFLLAGQRCLQHFTLRELASIVAYVTEENVAGVAAALRNQAGTDALTGLITVISPDETDESTAALAQPSLPPKRRSGLPAALSAPPPPRDPTQRTPSTEQDSAGQAYAEAEEAYDDTFTEPAVDRVDARQAPAHNAADSSDSAIGTLAADIADGAKRTLSQATLFFRRLFPADAATTTTVPLEVDYRRDVEDANREIGDSSPEQYSAQRALDHEQVAYDVDAPLSPQHAQSRPDPLPYDEPMADEDTFNQAYTADVDEPYDDEGASYEDELEALDPAYAQSAAPVPAPVSRPSSAEVSRATSANKRTSGRQARLFALLAILLLLVTVVIVASVSWVSGSRNLSEAERTLDMAQASFLSAQNALDLDDKSTARLRLLEAQDLINQATILVGSRLERGDQLNIQVEQELAGLLQIYPLQALTVPLVQFPPEAQPQRVIVSDQDIYVLDMGRQLVQHFELDPTRNLVLNTTGETLLAQGDTIEGATVGRLVDIAWLPPIAGVDDKAYLLVLDGNNNVFRYDRRVEGASRLELGGREDLMNPVHLQVYSDRLYLADAGSNQLYRYARGNFTAAPERWFDPQTQSNLGGLRSVAIDGDIWLLYEQGLLLRYRSGNQMQFSLETSFGQINDPVDLAVGDQGNSMIYIADSADERILVFDKDGRYERQLRAPEGDVLRNLRGISVDEVAGTMYILTQSFLFNHPLPN